MPDAVHRGLGVFALAVMTPLLLLLAAVVKADSPGPALYPAERMGVGGRPFRCFKFRTMIWQPHGDRPAITMDGDPRITRFGKVLRRFRIDELPQLINGRSSREDMGSWLRTIRCAPSARQSRPRSQGEGCPTRSIGAWESLLSPS